MAFKEVKPEPPHSKVKRVGANDFNLTSKKALEEICALYRLQPCSDDANRDRGRLHL